MTILGIGRAQRQRGGRLARGAAGGPFLGAWSNAHVKIPGYCMRRCSLFPPHLQRYTDGLGSSMHAFAEHIGFVSERPDASSIMAAIRLLCAGRSVNERLCAEPLPSLPIECSGPTARGLAGRVDARPREACA